MRKLSIIIPVYNEEKTIEKVLNRIEGVRLSLKKEIVIIDDKSTDSSKYILKKYSKKKGYKVIFLNKNRGKGNAVRIGLKNCSGDIMLIQDADLEYNPKDYPKLIKPIIKKEVEVVYGSRFKSNKGHLKQRPLVYLFHLIGNTALTFITNLLYSSKLTDMETCYKVFSRNAYDKIKPIKAKRFDLEPELTAKFLKKGHKIKEIMISYYSRDYCEGKKITWRDGIKAAYYLIKYRIMD